MLVSLSHKFIFVANLKSASSAIERALGQYAEIRVIQTRFGKHDDLSTIGRKFGWIRKYVPSSDLFIFGVMRDPVDFVLSLYNFHTASGFDGKPHSTKDLSFDEFWSGWCTRSWQARPQHFRFTDNQGILKISHVVDFAQLGLEFQRICQNLGLKATLPTINVSPMVLSRHDLSDQQIDNIKMRYADDYAFLANRPRAVWPGIEEPVSSPQGLDKLTAADQS
jgi:hypothetical protein